MDLGRRGKVSIDPFFISVIYLLFYRFDLTDEKTESKTTEARNCVYSAELERKWMLVSYVLVIFVDRFR